MSAEPAAIVSAFPWSGWHHTLECRGERTIIRHSRRSWMKVSDRSGPLCNRLPSKFLSSQHHPHVSAMSHVCYMSTIASLNQRSVSLDTGLSPAAGYTIQRALHVVSQATTNKQTNSYTLTATVHHVTVKLQLSAGKRALLSTKKNFLCQTGLVFPLLSK